VLKAALSSNQPTNACHAAHVPFFGVFIGILDFSCPVQQTKSGLLASKYIALNTQFWMPFILVIN